MTAFDERKSQIGNVIVVELLYLGGFGAGNNLNVDWLTSNGCWVALDPYSTE